MSPLIGKGFCLGGEESSLGNDQFKCDLNTVYVMMQVSNGRGCGGMSVTIKDVAKEANVAISTASRVINGSNNVSDGTRERVEQAVRKLGYKPNSIARSLKQKHTYSIGLVVPDIGNPFFAEVAQAVEQSARERGYSVLLANTNSKEDQEREAVDLLIAKQVDGIVWFAPIDRKLVDELSSSDNMEIVTISGGADPLGTHSININDQLGAVEAVSHLIKLGHTRIGYIAEPAHHTQERLIGYKAALKQAGIAVDTTLIERGTFKAKSGLDATKRLLSIKNPPTAIFAANDLMAVEAMQYMRGKGLRVPEDVAVVGFDDIELASLSGIELTTIAQPKYEMGREAAKLLISSLRRTTASRQVLLSPSLVVRKSCGASHRK